MLVEFDSFREKNTNIMSRYGSKKYNDKGMFKGNFHKRQGDLSIS